MQGILGRERQRLLRQDRRASLRWCDLRFVKTFLRRVNLLDAEAARMTIYRIQAVAPERVHMQCENNERNGEDSRNGDTHLQNNQIKLIRSEDHNGHEHTEGHLRRLFPRSSEP